MCIYLHSLSHCRPNGCQFSVSPPPTYSMGSVPKTACAGYSTLIITGSTDWRTDWKIALPWCKKFLLKTSLHLFYYKAIVEMSSSTSSITPGYSSVKNKLLWTQLKAHLSHRLTGKKRNFAYCFWSMQTIAKAETFLQHIKSSNISCELAGYTYICLLSS